MAPQITTITASGTRKLKLSDGKKSVLIGTAPTCDFVVRDKLAARQHCVIELKSGQNPFCLTDLEGGQGTQLNGLPASNAARLSPGDKLTFGNVSIAIAADPEGEPGSLLFTVSDDSLPKEVFDLPLLAEIPPHCKKLLEAEAYLEVAPAGDVFAQQGEYTGRFCIVLEGGVGAYREEDGKKEHVGVYGPGTWFGELSALSNQPELATLKVDSRCVLLVLEPPLFRQLYKKVGRKKRESLFQRMVDASYRKRSLAIHLRVAPVFKGLSPSMLEQLGRDAQFIDYEEGALIADARESADALYLVRSGAVKCSLMDKQGREQIVSYHMANSSFGERCLTEHRAWAGSFTAIAPTSLIKIPEEVFQRTLAVDSGALALLRQSADKIVSAELGVATTESAILEARSQQPQSKSADQLEVMVGRQSVKGGEALVINLDQCVRCNACVESCVAVHEDRVPRLSKTGTRVSGSLTLASSCYNCEVPECMMSCDHGAIRRDVKGQINFVWDNCVGCQCCSNSCPYGVISMTPPPLVPGEKTKYKRHWFLETLPFIGKLFSGSKPVGKRSESLDEGPNVGALRGGKVSGKAIKCDLCAGLPFEACVYNCPVEAIGRENPEQLFSSSVL